MSVGGFGRCALGYGVRGEFDLRNKWRRLEEQSVIQGALTSATLHFPWTRGLWSFSKYALHYACYAENTKAVACLLSEDRSKVNDPDGVHDDTPLITACRKGNLEIIRVLVENGADVSKSNIFSDSPIDFLDDRFDREIIDFLELEESKTYDRKFSRD